VVIPPGPEEREVREPQREQVRGGKAPDGELIGGHTGQVGFRLEGRDVYRRYPCPPHFVPDRSVGQVPDESVYEPANFGNRVGRVGRKQDALPALP